MWNNLKEMEFIVSANIVEDYNEIVWDLYTMIKEGHPNLTFTEFSKTRSFILQQRLVDSLEGDTIYINWLYADNLNNTIRMVSNVSENSIKQLSIY